MLDSGVFCNHHNLFVVFANVQNITLRMCFCSSKKNLKPFIGFFNDHIRGAESRRVRGEHCVPCNAIGIAL